MKLLPWENEPDQEQFEIDGYLVLLTRHPELKIWCGYVGIPEEKLVHISDLIRCFITSSQGQDLLGSSYSFAAPISYYESTAPKGFKHITPTELLSGQKRLIVPVWWVGFAFNHENALMPGDLWMQYSVEVASKSKALPLTLPFVFTPASPAFMEFCQKFNLATYFTFEQAVEEMKSVVQQIDNFLKNPEEKVNGNGQTQNN